MYSFCLKIKLVYPDQNGLDTPGLLGDRESTKVKFAFFVSHVLVMGLLKSNFLSHDKHIFMLFLDFNVLKIVMCGDWMAYLILKSFHYCLQESWTKLLCISPKL